MSPESYEQASLGKFLKGKKLTGTPQLNKIISEYRLGEWYDQEGYEEQGLILIKAAVEKASKLKNQADRETIADILWPEGQQE